MTLDDELDRCVMCGLCLPHCPTYRLTLNEAESPRGRLELLRGAIADPASVSDKGVAHIDHCLGCRSCEAMCPSKVQYGRLLDAGRTRLAAANRRATPLAVRTIERAARQPQSMARLVGAANIASDLMLVGVLAHLPVAESQAMAGLMKSVAESENHKLRASAATPLQPTVQLFLGCLDRHWNQTALSDAIKLIEACGYAVAIPNSQTCCGAISQHEGHTDHADELLAANRAAFSPDSPVISISTGCSSQLREHLGQASEDLLDFLSSHSDQLKPAPLEGRIALHVPCSQRNVLRSEHASSRLLNTIPNLEIIHLQQANGCCGAAGTHFLREPATAALLLDDLLDQLEAERPDRLLSPNLGCALHLRTGLRERGLDIPVEHPVSLLARQLARR